MVADFYHLVLSWMKEQQNEIKIIYNFQRPHCFVLSYCCRLREPKRNANRIKAMRQSEKLYIVSFYRYYVFSPF